MADTSNNPTAFPTRGGLGRSGMTLRDYFAGQALIAMGTWSPGTPTALTSRGEIWALRASYAYGQADAMLKARKLDD